MFLIPLKYFYIIFIFIDESITDISFVCFLCFSFLFFLLPQNLQQYSVWNRRGDGYSSFLFSERKPLIFHYLIRFFYSFFLQLFFTIKKKNVFYSQLLLQISITNDVEFYQVFFLNLLIIIYIIILVNPEKKKKKTPFKKDSWWLTELK